MKSANSPQVYADRMQDDTDLMTYSANRLKLFHSFRAIRTAVLDVTASAPHSKPSLNTPENSRNTSSVRRLSTIASCRPLAVFRGFWAWLKKHHTRIVGERGDSLKGGDANAQ